MKLLIFTFLFVTRVCLAVEPAERSPLRIPDGAKQVDVAKISFPLAHKAKKANLLFNKVAGDSDFCVIRPDQAGDLAGAQYKEKAGLKTILVKWSFIEPKDTKALDLVTAHAPAVFSMDGVIYVSSSGIDIGDIAKIAEGVFIVQVEQLPKKIVHKLSRVGW